MFHAWEGYLYNAAHVIQQPQEEIKINSRVYNYIETKDLTNRWTRAYFDELLPPMDYPTYIEHIQKNSIAYEPVTAHTYGRTAPDLAAVGIPTVGSNRVYSMQKCFPYTSVDPYDIKATKLIIKKLLTDNEFKEKVITTAKKNCEYFNYKNSKKRFLTAIDMVKNNEHHLKDSYWMWEKDKFVPAKVLK